MQLVICQFGSKSNWHLALYVSDKSMAVLLLFILLLSTLI